ncbi:hypothetical protein M0804_014006 [Polistes exclamans]|nr:hypothetical protein M0804_014011 [Polistes exclamans]KAI4475910.1 hypothetical protein M0804_014006 [Polistes exclamans]
MILEECLQKRTCLNKSILKYHDVDASKSVKKLLDNNETLKESLDREFTDWFPRFRMCVSLDERLCEGRNRESKWAQRFRLNCARAAHHSEHAKSNGSFGDPAGALAWQNGVDACLRTEHEQLQPDT